MVVPEEQIPLIMGSAAASGAMAQDGARNSVTT